MRPLELGPYVAHQEADIAGSAVVQNDVCRVRRDLPPQDIGSRPMTTRQIRCQCIKPAGATCNNIYPWGGKDLGKRGRNAGGYAGYQRNGPYRLSKCSSAPFFPYQVDRNVPSKGRSSTAKRSPSFQPGYAGSVIISRPPRRQPTVPRIRNGPYPPLKS